MKKSRIFMAAGACVLAITGVFATKANKKFTPISSADFTFSGTYSASSTMSLPNNHFTALSTSALPRVYIGLYTKVGSTVTVFAGTALVSGGNPVYAY